MLIVNAAVLSLAVPSIVVAVALGDSLVIAAVANQWNAPNWYTVGPAAGGLIAFVIAVRAERKATTNLRLGGAYAICALLALLAAGDLSTSDSVLQDLLAVAVLLGLAIAATIMEQHGGTLSGSNNLDRGMTFRLELPFQREVLKK